MACRIGHHKGERVKLENGSVRCAGCGKEFADRTSTVRHGTYRGYQKHRREGSRRWPWPIPEGACNCRQAARAYHLANEAKPENAELRRQRGAARQAAFLELRRTFPGMYTRFYLEALKDARGGEGLRRPRASDPVWDDIIASLYKTCLERDEATVADRVRSMMSTPQEREAFRLFNRLRVMLGRRPS